MEEGQRLSNDELRQAAEAVIACGVERDVLVAALGRTTRSLLNSRTTPGGQILEDLFALRDLGESHLREWIEQAFVLTKPRRESALFERLRKKLDDPIAEEPKRRREWGRVWVGREEEMAELEEAFAAPPGAQRPVAIVALQGMGGIGKTYLAERFAWKHADKFPGGRLQIPLEIERRPTLLDVLTAISVKLEMRTTNAHDVRATVLARRVLVHIDNADDEHAANVMHELAEALEGCALIVTGRYDVLPGAPTANANETGKPHKKARRVGAWTVVPVTVFDESTALAQIEATLERPIAESERDDVKKLAHDLGYLPLALSLAAAHLREGVTAHDFRRMLEEDRLDIDHPIPWEGDRDVRRRNLARTIDLSVKLLRDQLKERADALLPGMRAFAHAPLAGVGASLGAAITNLSSTDHARLMTTASHLSLIETELGPPLKRHMHPLVSQRLRNDEEAPAVVSRMTEWFVARLPEDGKSPTDARPQGDRWREVHAETDALRAWLLLVPNEAMPRVELAGSWYAILAGPFEPWTTFCERFLEVHRDGGPRSHALFTLSYLCQKLGAFNRALSAAQQKEQEDRAAGREHGAASAAGLRADILHARGQLNEALRIRQEEVLPVYEKLGDSREAAIIWIKIADILHAHRQLDAALRIYQEELLPLFEKLDDIRSTATVWGRIANILYDRGQLDEALRVHQERELPVFERLGDIREAAITWGKIADIFYARGRLDESLRIRQEQVLSVLDKLGAQRDILVARTNIALVRLQRNQPGDRPEAERLLRLALLDAEALRIPEAETIRGILRKNGFPL